jgi:hypothetical protein
LVHLGSILEACGGLGSLLGIYYSAQIEGILEACGGLGSLLGSLLGIYFLSWRASKSFGDLQKAPKFENQVSHLGLRSKT